MGIRCNEVVQVLVNDTTVALICPVASRGIWVNVDFRFANAEWMCRVGLMSRVSHRHR